VSFQRLFLFDVVSGYVITTPVPLTQLLSLPAQLRSVRLALASQERSPAHIPPCSAVPNIAPGPIHIPPAFALAARPESVSNAPEFFSCIERAPTSSASLDTMAP